MPAEIERKFLVTGDAWKANAVSVSIVQGYLSRDPDRVVRVRMSGPEAFLTVKGRTSGITRTEVEFPVPPDDARALLAFCLPPLLEKTRHKVMFGSHLWEVDEFHGENAGLIVAEIELASEDEPFEMPPWAEREVSHDFRYTNSRLAEHPFTSWSHPA